MMLSLTTTKKLNTIIVSCLLGYVSEGVSINCLRGRGVYDYVWTSIT